MKEKLKEKPVRYYLNEKAEFVIENYNFSKPFANFFPGIAGKYGIPMWVFYVNRGQAITSFGTKDKDHAILEFFPANRAWQLVTFQGFRSFIKILDRKKTLFWEPFQNGLANLGFNLTNSMHISSYGLTLQEVNLSLGLEVNVEYFNIPNDSYAGLVRVVRVKNLKPVTKNMQLLDGLPQIVPFGTSNLFLKKLGRTIEAWMKVENLDKGVPFYKLDVDPTDRPEVIHIKEGNFYLGFHYHNNAPQIIRPIVDPQCIFGPVMDFSLPQEFLATNNFSLPKKENIRSKRPCGFLLLNLKLPPRQEKTFYSVIGFMRNLETLNSSIPKIVSRGYLSMKDQENKKVIEDLMHDINTISSSREFNLYAKQTYLDNIIRGGYPITFKSGSVYYLYSRKHGDLERDYNKFQLQPAYFSQGNGNYRDTNQNRRCDLWFNPDIKDDNLICFFNLIQTDGFNPLVVKGVSFMLKQATELKAILDQVLEEKQILKIQPFLNKPYTPGDAILFLEENKIKLKCPHDEFLDILISNSTKIQEAEHGEGFWTDHWAYNLDLLESYLGLYPEKFKEILFEKKVFTFFDSTEVVKPRNEKYILKDGKVKQLHSVGCDHAKREMIKKRAHQPHAVRTQYGNGEIYQATLMSKLLCILVNKLASFDPFGCGIEMEADKPNWFDALNGLPAIFGSSLCETFELKRLAIFIKEVLEKSDFDEVYVTEEVHNFLTAVNRLINQYLNEDPSDKDYQFWDRTNSLKEDYRNKTRYGVSGNEFQIKTAELKNILNNALIKINSGLLKCLDRKRKIYYAYFINEVAEYDCLKEHFVKPKKFIQKRLPFFLEGQMHGLRLSQNLDEAKQLYKATKASELYDKSLKMYKVTAPLEGMPEEIGRCRVFTPGWLENESIWLHMQYKYLLETLENGLYKEFYADFKSVLIPFLDPKKYGRSILENSSFLVSSVFPDKNLHGNGFVARLSGSTAEFLQIWLMMNVGKTPFFLNAHGELNLKFDPVLAGWLFTKKDKTYSFNFLGKILVVYHNSKRIDTFGRNSVKIKKIVFVDKDGLPVALTSDTIPFPYAEQVRARQIKRIDIFLM